MDNVQTFSLDSEQYARHRPQYPEELFSYLNEITSGHDSAWDCATGNGQAAVSCARYFSHVIATDISAEQIRHRIAHPRINYIISTAEHTPFDNESVDLVVVATAVHWLDQPRFFQEVERVLRPEGILAIWGYGFLAIEPEIDRLLAAELFAPIDPFWASGNRQMFNHYRDVSLPFDEIYDPPVFAMQVEWNLEQLLAFLRTWSAVKRYAAELGHDPVERVEMKLKIVWNEPEKAKVVKMPIFFRASRKSA